MCGVPLKKHLSNEALRGRLSIGLYIRPGRCSRLRWFGNVERKDDQAMGSRICMDFKGVWYKRAGRGTPFRKSLVGMCERLHEKKFGFEKKRWHTIEPCGGHSMSWERLNLLQALKM